jgi:hypothetical protein
MNKKMRTPKASGGTIMLTSSARFYITKSEDDPFDLEYTITIRSKIGTFKSALSDFFKQNNICFDFDLFYDKQQLLDDIQNELNRLTGLKLTIECSAAFIIFTDNVLLKTKSDVIEL